MVEASDGENAEWATDGAGRNVGRPSNACHRFGGPSAAFCCLSRHFPISHSVYNLHCYCLLSWIRIYAGFVSLGREAGVDPVILRKFYV